MKNLASISLICSFVIFGQSVFADALPKGSLQKVDEGKVKGPPKYREPEGTCINYFAYPMSDNGFLAKMGLYLLSSVGPIETKSKSGKKIKSHKYVVHNIDPKTQKGNLEASIVHKSDAALATFGEPVSGVSAISFVGKEKTCATGMAGMTGVTFAKSRKNKAIRKKGKYELVRGVRGALVMDLKDRKLIDMDMASFQTRTITRVPEKERPIFYDSGKKELVVFKEAGSKKGLVKYKVSPGGNKEDKKFAIGPKDRVVVGQTGEFVIVTLAENGKVQVKKIKGWSGAEETGSVEIELPDGLVFSKAVFVLNLDMSAIAVTGRDLETKSRLGKVVLYNTNTGKVMETLKAPAGHYFNYLGISTNASMLIAESVQAIGKKTKGLVMYDFEMKKVKDMPLILSLKD